MKKDELNTVKELRGIKRVLLLIAALLAMIVGILNLEVLVMGTLFALVLVILGFVFKAIFQAIRRADALLEQRERAGGSFTGSED